MQFTTVCSSNHTLRHLHRCQQMLLVYYACAMSYSTCHAWFFWLEKCLCPGVSCRRALHFCDDPGQEVERCCCCATRWKCRPVSAGAAAELLRTVFSALPYFFVLLHAASGYKTIVVEVSYLTKYVTSPNPCNRHVTSLTYHQL